VVEQPGGRLVAGNSFLGGGIQLAGSVVEVQGPQNILE